MSYVAINPVYLSISYCFCRHFMETLTNHQLNVVNLAENNQNITNIIPDVVSQVLCNLIQLNHESIIYLLTNDLDSIQHCVKPSIG
ncbi:conserved hypothetical protein [Xenorhabdus bovienii str. oregonense]|nr:conserved hypothetical protein [Xenorhabdus bovienii str. oregonense]